jgi:hypothetical protein
VQLGVARPLARLRPIPCRGAAVLGHAPTLEPMHPFAAGAAA